MLEGVRSRVITALIGVTLIAGCGAEAGDESATLTDVAIETRTLVLDEAPEDDDGPLCWISFAEGVREGGCRTGALTMVEYSMADGLFVEGWNGVVSHVEVPEGWDVHTFHQMWANGEEDMKKRQGYVHHPGGTTAAFYQETYSVVRYGLEYDWRWCRTWNQEAIDANRAEDDEGTNDTVQCLHIEPDPAEPATLVVAADHPVEQARLEITYDPDAEPAEPAESDT